MVIVYKFDTEIKEEVEVLPGIYDEAIICHGIRSSRKKHFKNPHFPHTPQFSTH